MKHKRYIKYKDTKVLTSYRRGEGEVESTDLILEYLEKNNYKYKVQEFDNEVPFNESVNLTVDGKKINALNTGFVGGRVEGLKEIFSNTLDQEPIFSINNINFSPYSDVISCSSFYNSVSCSISRRDVLKVVKGKKIILDVLLEKYKYRSRNILVGNLENPSNIVFCHIDTINHGFIDNASGVLACLNIIEDRSFIEKNLVVFSGNEELSYQFPNYWGKGYRMFESKYENLFKSAKKIIIIDCIAQTKPILSNDVYLGFLAFPIKNQKKYQNKIYVLSGEIDSLMPYYHSFKDERNLFNENYFKQSIKLFSDFVLK